MSRFSYLLPESLKEKSYSDEGGRESDCKVCGQPSVTRCLVCKNVGYCGEEHLKLDWPTHILTCSASLTGTSLTQGALLFIGSLTCTPSSVPRTLGHLTSLNRPHLASLLLPPAPPERLKVLISPISSILDPDDYVAVAYDAGPRGQRMEGGLGGMVFNSAEGGICRIGVSFTRDLKTGRGIQLRGSCILFFLKAGRDFKSDDLELFEELTNIVWPITAGGMTDEVRMMFRDTYYRALDQKLKSQENLEEEMRKRKEEEDRKKEYEALVRKGVISWHR